MKVKPVMLPPGRDRLATKPCPTGSLTTLNTIGIVLVACFSAAVIGVPLPTMRSGAERTNSVAEARNPAQVSTGISMLDLDIPVFGPP